MSVTKEFDMSWSVKFEITLDGCDASFFDLDEAAQEYCPANEHCSVDCYTGRLAYSLPYRMGQMAGFSRRK